MNEIFWNVNCVEGKNYCEEIFSKHVSEFCVLEKKEFIEIFPLESFESHNSRDVSSMCHQMKGLKMLCNGFQTFLEQLRHEMVSDIL